MVRGGITAGLTSSGQRLKDPLCGVERLVGDQRIGRHRGQQVVGSLQSSASPPERKKPIGLPSASAGVWILVLSPPRERPIAWSSPAFLGDGAMLVGAHNGAVDHRVFVVGVCARC